MEDYGHEHFHFNLKNRDTINKIIETIENLKGLYDNIKVQNINDKQVEINNNIVNLIIRKMIHRL